MPDNHFKEVSIDLIACITLFLLLGGIILLFLLLYQRKRYQQQRELKDLNQQFKEQSLKAQVEIQEQTFLAIAQEIHDNVGQVLSLARVQINILSEKKIFDETLLTSLGENIGKAMADLRDLSRSLNSDSISHDKIHDTLIREAERINKTGRILMEVYVTGEFREIEAKLKLILFRVLQEGLQNCIRHAEASRIRVSFDYQAETVAICLEDDGIGFDPDSAMTKGGGQGLVNMHNRIMLAGGSIRIKSQAKEGVSISLKIPYE